MNPNLCRVALRPRDPFEVLDLGFRFARERWAPFARLLAVTVLPPFLLGVLLCWLLEGHAALALLPLAVGGPLQAPFTAMAGRMLFTEEVGVREVLVDVLVRLPALLASWGLGAIGWVAASFTCFMGAPWVQAGLLYLTEAALLERVGPQRGLQRSLRLASGHMGIALVGGVSRWVITVWLGLVGELSGQAVVGFVLQLGEPFGALTRGDVTPWLLGGMLLAQPVHAVYRLLLYVDIRTRMEGWDLQVSLRALGLGADR